MIAEKLSELKHVKKITGNDFAYRIRIGNFRIGFLFNEQTITLVRILNRKDIYKYFP